MVHHEQPNVRRKQGRGDRGGQLLDQEVQGCDEVRFLSGESMCVSIIAHVKEGVGSEYERAEHGLGTDGWASTSSSGGLIEGEVYMSA